MNIMIDYCVSCVCTYISLFNNNNNINDNIDIHIPDINLILKNKDINSIFNDIIKKLEIKFPLKKFSYCLDTINNSICEFVYFEWNEK